MHPDLDTWLNQVWADRQKIMGLSPTGHSGRGVHLGDDNPAIWAIYKMYKKSEDGGGASSADISTVAGFIDELDGLEKSLAGAATAVLQYNGVVRLNRGQLSTVKAAPFDTKTDKNTPVRVDQTVVGNAFIHFIKETQAVTRNRIYINIQRAHLGSAFRSLMSAVWNEPLLCSGKVTGPMAPTRADTIVIYLGDGPLDSAIGKVRAYHDKNKGQFGGSTPKLTAPIKEMTGVALGMEPPGIAVISSGGEYYFQAMKQSFGFYRSMLIFMALDRTHWTQPGQTDIDRCNSYKRRAEKYFRKAGIDPDRPSEQGETQGLKPIEDLKREIEIEKDEAGKPAAKVHIKK